MAIAFVTAVDGTNNGGITSSLTFSHTCGSGSDRLLVVVVWGDLSSNADQISGVTYNGVAMTRVDEINVTDGRWNYLYYLLNPSSGANNVVISSGGTHYIGGLAGDYTGVAQSGQPDATDTDSSQAGSSATASVTTTADNCWLICAGYMNSALQAGTGATSRVEAAAFDNGGLFDSNGPITPAGAASLEVESVNPGTAGSIVGAAFAPAGAAATTYGRLIGRGMHRGMNRGLVKQFIT